MEIKVKLLQTLVNQLIISKPYSSYRCMHTTVLKFTKKNSLKYAKYFQALDLETNATPEATKNRYIQLVKKFHPDSGHREASMEMFLMVDEAFKMLQKKFYDEKGSSENPDGESDFFKDATNIDPKADEDYVHPDIRHTAPQHRQFLENEGFGYGTPSQRQRQFGKFKAARAAENVYKHRIDKLVAKYETRLATNQRSMTKDQLTANTMDRMVEDLISESMANGEFDNLSGSGKPLPNRLNYNPYMDFTSHKINEILVEGGFAPEWIMLKKDIRDEIATIRKFMSKKRLQLGPLPLSENDSNVWKKMCQDLREKEVQSVNKSIDKYNLIVPMMNGQMFHFQLEREAEKILSEFNSTSDQQRQVLKLNQKKSQNLTEK